jgi:hypothetical protein
MQHIASVSRVGLSYRRHGAEAIEVLADGRIVRFSNTATREAFLEAHHPNTYAREQRQREEIALVNGRGLL